MDFIKRNLAFLLVVIGTLILLIGGVFLFSRGGSSNTQSKVDNSLLEPAYAQKTGGLSNGIYLPANSNPGVTVVEFGDYQCPACGAYNTLVQQLLGDFSGKINFVFRDFAFIGPESTKASEATYCALDQGKYWEFHEYLYAHQNGENKGGFSGDNLKSFAGTLGLDNKTFTSCLDTDKYLSNVEKSTNDGKLAGVDSTPTFFINGIKIVNPNSYDGLKQMVQDALNKSPISQGSPSSAYHIHFDLKVFQNGNPIDFTLAKYQESKTNPLDENIHFHGGNGNVVHVHAVNVPLSELFSSFKLSFPSGISGYVNGKPVQNILSYVPKDLDRILIGGTDITSVTNDSCIYSLKCPARGTPPPEDCVGGLGTGCSD